VDVALVVTLRVASVSHVRLAALMVAPVVTVVTVALVVTVVITVMVVTVMRDLPLMLPL
jgi:hypothetical protein